MMASRRGFAWMQGDPGEMGDVIFSGYRASGSRGKLGSYSPLSLLKLHIMRQPKMAKIKYHSGFAVFFPFVSSPVFLTTDQPFSGNPDQIQKGNRSYLIVYVPV